MRQSAVEMIKDPGYMAALVKFCRPELVTYFLKNMHKPGFNLPRRELFDLDSFPPEPHRYGSTAGTTLIQIFSVNIKSLIPNVVSLEIYGTIKVIDGLGVFNLYEREEFEPETVLNGGQLTLVLPNCRAITPWRDVTLEFKLKDRLQNVEVLNASCYWAYSTKFEYDQEVEQVVADSHGFATIRYSTLSCAAIATVQVALQQKNGNCRSSNTQIYGTIVAHCGKKFSVTLFEKHQNEAVEVHNESYIPLSGPVIAVPSDFSFRIILNLWDGETQQEIASGVCEDYASQFNRSSSTNIDGKNVLIKTKVEWTNVFMQHVGDECQEEFPSAAKRSRHSVDRPPLRSLNFDGWLSALREDFRNYDIVLMELFSVSIHSNGVDDINLYGSIEYMAPPKWRQPLFSKDKDSPERLSPNQMVSIEYPTKCLAGLHFSVSVDLYDVNGSVISRGDIDWGERHLTTPLSWYNRKLCSVVNGDDGYSVAFHYSLFNCGVQATVKIYLEDKGSLSNCRVHGSVYGQYNNYSYSTIYDKEYYRRKFYVKAAEDSLAECYDANVPFSESVMVVPDDSDLDVDVKLNVENVDEMNISAAEKFESVLGFGIMESGKSMKKAIEGAHHRIVILVEWNEVWLVEPDRRHRRFNQSS